MSRLVTLALRLLQESDLICWSARMSCHISPRNPRRPLPAARWPRKSPPAVRRRTTHQSPRQPRDRYPVTNMTDIHLCRTSSSGNRGRFPGLAGSGRRRRRSPFPHVKGPAPQV